MKGPAAGATAGDLAEPGGMVRELLGHADLKMTRRYGHLSQRELKGPVNLLNSLAGGKEMVNISPKVNGGRNPCLC